MANPPLTVDDKQAMQEDYYSVVGATQDEKYENASYASKDKVQPNADVITAVNPAYSTNTAIVPDLMTKENVAYNTIGLSSPSAPSQHDPTSASADPATASNPAYGTNVFIGPHIETKTNLGRMKDYN